MDKIAGAIANKYVECAIGRRKYVQMAIVINIGQGQAGPSSGDPCKGRERSKGSIPISLK